MIGLIKRLFCPPPAKKPVTELIEELNTIRIERDDVLIFTAKQMLTPNQKHEIEALVRLKLGLENKIIIFDEGLTFGVLRP